MANKPMFGGKKAAPFKKGGGRDKTHPHTAKGLKRKTSAKK
jgi:hypothetical protein